MLELGGHGVVLHGHEQRVQHDADGDGQVNKRIHDNQVHNLLQLHPVWVALPDQECVGKFVPARGALPLGLFQLCRHKIKQNNNKTKRNGVQASSLRLKDYKNVNFVKMATEVTREKSWAKFVGRLDRREGFFMSGQVLELGPGRFGVSIPGGVQGMTLSDQVRPWSFFPTSRVLGFWDFMILWSFSFVPNQDLHPKFQPCASAPPG